MRTTTITVRVDASLVGRLDALTERLPASSAPGPRMTRTAVARLALRHGIEALEASGTGPRPDLAQLDAVHTPDLDDLDAAMDALERVAQLDLCSPQVEALHALADLDVDVLRALRRLDIEIIDALAALDTGTIDALDRLATGALPDLLDRLEDLR